MKPPKIIKTKLIQDNYGIWSTNTNHHFDYSDGDSAENYLWKTINKSKDLSSNSQELKKYIKDWPSEYHLSEKRSQLLSGFDFQKKGIVLEIGCGCGAITRFLSEQFETVIAIEGSRKRARIAKQRTNDRNNVHIICANFQDIDFTEKFDIVFCIGVLEYSGSFIQSPAPYDYVLKHLHKVISKKGSLILSIENQFGLKYFNGYKEDHLNIPFVGIEGYASTKKSVKTFGKEELTKMLNSYFANIQFFYPYPDYKLPDCVVSDEFFSIPNHGELISKFSKHRNRRRKRLWNEKLVSLELEKNNSLSFFSNSFLIAASNEKDSQLKFPQLGIFFSSKDRRQKFQTYNTIKYSNGEVRVSKHLLNGQSQSISKKLKLKPTTTLWQEKHSLQTILFIRSQQKNMSLEEIFSPCKSWIEYLLSKCFVCSGQFYIDGKFIDCIWPNFYPTNKSYTFIDDEWNWHSAIKLKTLFIRAAFNFVNETLYPYYPKDSTKTTILKILNSQNIAVTKSDFYDFLNFESDFQSIVTGHSKKFIFLKLLWKLNSLRSYNMFKKTLRSSFKTYYFF